MSSPFVVGIDLGTTNCALAYVDMTAAERVPQILPIPQWETPETTVISATLPSFYWLPIKSEWKRGQLRLPLHARDGEPPDYAVGRVARSQASVVPGRVVHSAKSWLCHAGVSRQERILPWHSDEIVGVERRSPIEVSAAYLAHLKDAWNDALSEGLATRRLEAQDIVITVPASFDDAAQRLTLDAAEKAGFPRANIRLLEEPQAAFYHWLARGEAHRAQLSHLIAERAMDKPRPLLVLICDIGGGTSDFSSFEISMTAGSSAPQIRRVAVSQHLLLGGDNIDLALAHLLEPRLVGEGKQLSSRQWAQLTAQARQLKERALEGDGAAELTEWHVAIAGEGSTLFGNTLTASVTRAEIVRLIVDGFFPDCARDDKPHARRAGLAELGLPYAADSAVSRHLAGFLAGRAVDALLFAGGTLKPQFLQERIRNLVASWQESAPIVLESTQLDLAVALGAAYSGAVRRDQTLHIAGGYPRSLYIAATRSGSSGSALVCIVPKGLEAGHSLAIDQLDLKAVVGRAASFQLFSATDRSQDRAGDVVPFDSARFHPLPPLHTKLEAPGIVAGALVGVGLEASITQTGLLELFCRHKSPAGSDHKWQLVFDVRAVQHRDEALATHNSVGSSVAAEKIAQAQSRIEALFGKKKAASSADHPKTLVKDIEQLIDRPRDQWDGAFLRSLWPAIESGANRRGRSVAHEAAWLWLAGFALRPGYGFALDEWRVAELWKVYQQGMSFPKERQVEDQWWILWRRVAGGLSREQQEKIFDKIFPALRQDTASSELYMLLASLERVDMTRRLRLGNHLVQPIAAGRKQFLDQRIWALGRVASRVPLYGGPEAIVRPKFVGEWLDQLKGSDYPKLSMLYSQAARLLGDREFDLPESMRVQAQDRLKALRAPEDLLRVTRELVAVDSEAQSRLFGESLPTGLILA